jgi:hypothetical protein
MFSSDAIIAGLHRWRYGLLALLLALAVGLWPGVRAAVQVDNSLSIWFLEGDPALRSYRTFQRLFGNDEVVIVAVQDSATSLLTPANQRRLVALSADLGALPSVQRVLGPATARVPAAGGLGSTMPLLGPSTTPRWPGSPHCATSFSGPTTTRPACS